MTDGAATTPPTAGRRRGGRGTGTPRAAVSTLKYRRLKHRFPPIPVVSEDELEAIHDASLTILEEIGMDFMHAGAREILKKAGADNIRFLCLLAAPEGVARMREAHPDVPIFTAAHDRGLNDRKYILPGLGDFGDRLYGT